MKVALVILALVGCALAYPQYNNIDAPDFRRIYLQDDSGQHSGSFSTRDIQRTDTLTLIPNGQGDYVPLQRSVIEHIAPNGEHVQTIIDAGLQGAHITGSHIPRA